MTKNNDNKYLGFYIETELYDSLKSFARKDERSLSYTARKMITDKLTEEGCL